jgi:hypothetical protein
MEGPCRATPFTADGQLGGTHRRVIYGIICLPDGTNSATVSLHNGTSGSDPELLRLSSGTALTDPGILTVNKGLIFDDGCYVDVTVAGTAFVLVLHD